ncbi:MAG: sodium:solute symporter family protein [Planctomycetota bacterium]|jgi:Na+/proline symporter
MTSIQWAALVLVTVLLLALTALGAVHARRVRTAEDFAVAGRRFGPLVLAGTLIATWIGTGSLFGNAEKAYSDGVSTLFLPIAGSLGILVLAWLAPRSRAIPALTVPGILGYRFGAAAQRLGGVALIMAYLIIVSYQYRAGTSVAQRIFSGVDPLTLRVGFAAFIILYTALAGMVSVVMTDVANGVILSAGVLIALILLLVGWRAAGIAEPAPPPNDWYAPGGGNSAVAWAGLVLPTFLLVLGDANLHQRFMSAKSPAAARRSAIYMFVGVTLLEVAIIGLALLGRRLLPEPLDNPGHVIIEMGFTILPPVVGLLIAATAVAVIVSTADSFLLASSTSLSVDFGRTPPSAATQRIIVVVLGSTALALSFLSDAYFDIALYAYTLYGTCLTPAILCALLRPKTPRIAVVGSMAAGLIVALAWKHPALSERFDPVLPALGANLLVLVVLAIILPERPPSSGPDAAARG